VKKGYAAAISPQIASDARKWPKTFWKLAPASSGTASRSAIG
jgi:hypothetical protein